MQKSNTLLYHSHILNNIDTLDKRKDRYVNYRLQFLQQHCLPIRKKIEAIKQDIIFYQNMRDTAYEVIQSQPDIVLLKSQIKQYKQTNKYYDNKLDQYNRTIAYLETNLHERNKALSNRKQQLRVLFALNGGKEGLQYQRSKKKANTIRIGSNATLKTNQSKQDHKQFKKSKYFNENNNTLSSNNMQRSERFQRQSILLNQQQEQNMQKLPQIQIKKAHQNYYSVIQQKQKQRHQRNKDRIDKIIQRSHHYKSLHVSRFFNDDQIQLNPQSLQDIKQIIAQFDHTEALFRQCFERKKLSIQKSVSQLQPKLISNKQLFLKACGAIGEKQGSFTYENFCNLTTDELITLFISFSWLGRRMYNQFTNKRKDLTNILQLIKKIQSQK